MTTIKATFAAAVLLIVGVWLYEVSDYLLVWSRRVAFLAGQGARWGGLLLVLLVAFGCIAYLLRQRHEHMRQRDGAWAAEYQPLVVGPRRLWLWLCGKPAPKLRLDPNAHLGYALAIDAAGVHEYAPAAGWDRQAAYMADQERTNRVRAIAPGDAAISLPWFGGDVRAGIANAATGRLLAGAYDRPPRVQTVDAEPEPLQLPPPELTPAAAVNASRPASLVLGQTDGGDLMRWDFGEKQHLRVHGATQGAGKTNAIQVAAAAALRAGAHVVVCDRVDFKDWTAFAHCAELVDTSSPAILGDALARLLYIYHRRTQVLARTGARNIASYRGQMQRIVVVISEFGAQMATARAEGMGGEVEPRLIELAQLAGSTGIHLVAEDQAVKGWDRRLTTNLTPVIGRMPKYSAQACGYQDRKGAPLPDTFPRGTFWHEGRIYHAPNMEPALRTLLADVPAPRLRVMNTPRWEGGVPTAPGTGGGVGVPGALPLENAGTERNTGTIAEDAPGRWDDVVAAWFTQNPQALTGPALGISDLARAMCRDNEGGNDANYEAYKGRSHKLFHAFRASVRLPNGAPLGTDITGGAA